MVQSIRSQYAIKQIIHQRYEVLQQLGNSSFAQTYLVNDLVQPDQGRAVLKLLKPKHRDQSFVNLAHSLFQQEVEILKALGHHPSIPALLAELNQDGEIGLVQTFIEGTSLHTAFRQHQFWSEAELVKFLTSALTILDMLHGAGFVHCDLTPAHWIQPFGAKPLVLIDFNSAQRVSTTSKRLATTPDLASGFTIGTRSYMAPEQLQGHADCRTDLYALGLISLQGITGRSPMQLSRNIQGEISWQSPIPLKTALIDILTHLVRYRPQDRYQSAAAVLDDLTYIQPKRWQWWRLKRSGYSVV
ncbi:MAG: serine/threonine protein kinase [Thermosynechococcaceae cyanobacterium MS004]|nr:serine/threonine protein kinase [Thermosynechococcaceae cyanobacterium MS004]